MKLFLRFGRLAQRWAFLAVCTIAQAQFPAGDLDPALKTLWQHNEPKIADLAVGGSLIYVAYSDEGLRVLDTTNVESPRLVGAYPLAGVIRGLTVLGNRAAVLHENYLQIIDVSNPSSPRDGGRVHLPGARSVAIDGDIAYVALGGSGLAIVDLSVPDSPAFLNTVATGGWASAVEAGDGYAYVAGRALNIIDVRTPSAPVVLSTLESIGGAGHRHRPASYLSSRMDRTCGQR